MPREIQSLIHTGQLSIPMTPPAYIYTQNRTNELHASIRRGRRFWQRAESMITSGMVGVNQRDSTGATAILYATWHGSERLLRVLLAHGADVAAVNAGGFTALHAGAMRGEAGLTGLLLEAGADIDKVQPDTGTSALHMAAQMGHDEVIHVLVRAGANVNKRAVNGETPLYMAASRGEARAVGTLLRANADPLLEHFTGVSPLEIAVNEMYPEVVRELVDRVGIRCMGRDNGHRALVRSAGQKQTSILEILSRAGVVDLTGEALCAAVSKGLELSVKFLLKASIPVYEVIEELPPDLSFVVEKKVPNIPTSALDVEDNVAIHVNVARDHKKQSVIWCCFEQSSLGLSSARILRMLFDSGLDNDQAETEALSANNLIRNMEEAADYNPMDQKVLGLRGIHRLLLQSDAVHAASWRWISHEVGTSDATATAASAPLRRMLPILRRRAVRPRILLTAFSRFVVYLPIQLEVVFIFFAVI
jgi:ankyrin repeat protein